MPGAFTAMMVESEISVLRCLDGMLEADTIDSRDEFTDLMRAAFDHGKLEARALSDDLGFNFTTVYRWIEGRSAPHPSLWPRVVEWVRKSIIVKVDEYESFQQEHVQTP